MGLDDWTDDDEVEDQTDEETQSTETTPKSLVEALDRHIVEAAESDSKDINVDGQTVTADRTTLSTTVAVAISNFDSDEIKELEDLTMAEVQNK